MPLHPDIALLAPVPLVHLEDGVEVSERKGKVAFGSMAWEFFKKLDEDRGGLAVETFIYASHADVRDLAVTWHARYIGHVTDVEPRRFRPKSTLEGDKGGWGVYWLLEGLARLTEPIPIAELCAYGTGEPFGKGFVPEGPMRVAHGAR
jgi:hypothetical protein